MIKNEVHNYKSNITGGVIRDATKWELEHANMLTSKQDLASSSQSSANSIAESLKPPKLVDKFGVWAPSDPMEEKDSKLSSTKPEKFNSTFAPEDGTFRKYTYKDVQNQRYGMRLDEDRKPGHYYETTEEPLEEHVVNERDVGRQYNDPKAMLDDPAAFPLNLTAGEPWSRRIIRFFQPTKSYPFELVRSRLPHVYNTTVEYDDGYTDIAYTNPCIREKDPIVWICKDPMGVSQQQIDIAKEIGVDVRDDFTKYNEKGKPMFTFNPPDFELKVKR